MTTSACHNDQDFGPAVKGCREDFDFTQKFERIFFLLVPAALFIPLAATQVSRLIRRPKIVRAIPLQILKIVFIIIHAVLQLGLLVVACVPGAIILRELSIAGLSLVVAAQILLAAVSVLQHTRSRRPSFLVDVYLLLTLLFDIAQARTLWLASVSTLGASFARLFTSAVAVKLVVLCLEAWDKTRWIVPDAATNPQRSPEESSGFYSLASYSWLRLLFLRGYRKVLALDDLYPLDSELSIQRVAPRVLEKLHHSHLSGKKETLLWTLLTSFPWHFMLPILPRTALIGFRFAQSFLLQALLQYLEDPDPAGAESRGYGLIGACALVYIGMAVSSAFFGYFNNRISYMVRASLCAAVYRRTTEAALSSTDSTASLTLMSTDVSLIETGLLQIHQIWSGLVEVALGSWLLYTQIGLAFLTPLGLIIICSALLTYVMSFIEGRQTFWMSKIQTRVGVTASAIAGMKDFKVLGIADRVASMIHDHRVSEIKAGNRFRVLILATVVLSYTPMSLSAPVAFAAARQDIATSKLFVSLTFILLLSAPLLTFFQAIPVFLAGLASLGRIHAFLVETPLHGLRRILEKVSDIKKSRGKAQTASLEKQPYAFVATKASFGWTPTNPILRELDFHIPKGQITIIIGPTASGKSTMCHALLGEILASSGSLNAWLEDSAIGYCAQIPYLSSGTVRENVVGFTPFDQGRYDAVIDATMLRQDIATFPAGNDFEIGDKGIKLSGGQKQRLALARSLYLRPTLFIFDDPLSGLDRETEAAVFDHLLGSGGLIRDYQSTAVYFTSSSQHLSDADHVIVLNKDGTILKQGPPETVAQHARELIAAEDPASKRHMGPNTTEATDPLLMDAAGGSTENRAEASDKGVADQARRTGDVKVYLQYLRSTATTFVVLTLLFCLVAGFCSNFATVWLSYWAQDYFSHDRSFYLGIFSMLRAAELIAIGGAAAFLMLGIVSSSGSKLHLEAIKTVARASLTLFSDTNTGTITNHFSQDLTVVDIELPLTLLNLSLVVFDLTGNFFVIAVSSVYLIATYPILLAILYFVQLFYLRTSRQLRLLDLESKSPLYAHFLDTIQGLVTIRAQRTMGRSVDRNNDIVNASQRPAYFLTMIQQGLQTTLLMLVGIVAVSVTALATQLKTNASFTGASFVTLMTLSAAITELMQSYTQLETCIGAVSRLKAFSQGTATEDENQGVHGNELSASWPTEGHIQLANVSASYRYADAKVQTNDLSLVNLSLVIQPGERVAICGRTGSGKSSLLLLLLRLLNPVASSSTVIELDHVPIHTISRTMLRQRLITIPQDPVFLPGEATIHDNLDYLGESTLEDCMSVVEATQLSDFVREAGGLDGAMCPEKLSSGQKQLFSLARAMVRLRVRRRLGAASGGILLVDELNSRLDTATDALIQDIITKEFTGYTIIIIAHRLDIVVNLCNRVAVLEKGHLVEVGDPRALLDNQESLFGRLFRSD
ncbi:P-loop containing nucleoside triphosphate hydrolase protein [Sarocladium strictum]